MLCWNKGRTARGGKVRTRGVRPDVRYARRALVLESKQFSYSCSWAVGVEGN